MLSSIMIFCPSYAFFIIHILRNTEQDLHSWWFVSGSGKTWDLKVETIVLLGICYISLERGRSRSSGIYDFSL